MFKMLIAGTLVVGSLVLLWDLAPSLPRVRQSLGAWIAPAALAGEPADKESSKVRKSEDEWKKTLTPDQYQVLRCSATEAPFTGKYWDHKEKGVYHCAGCNAPLFASDSKFESGSGWPSYFAPIYADAVGEVKDISQGMVRTEIICNRCEAHLGHVFRDGPRPTGLRYCVNSLSLEFVPAQGEAEDDIRKD